MSFIDLFLSDSEAFDENEASDLALHYRQEQRRHHKADQKLTLLVWLVSLFFAAFLADAPNMARTVIEAMIK